MENHRLKAMPENYDESLFNKIYQETANLRKALASQIDARRFGVDNEMILSYFDDKFIYVFSKYYNQVNSNVLKGYIINSLKTFKLKLVKTLYLDKWEFFNNLVTLEIAYYHNEDGDEFEVDDLTEIADDSEYNLDHDFLLNLVDAYMQEHLSPDAYQVYKIQLNPPLYIIDRLTSSTQKIPNALLLEFLEIPATKEVVRQLQILKKEIEEAITSASLYFKNYSLNI